VESFHLLIFIPLLFLIIYFYYSQSLLFTRRFWTLVGISTTFLFVAAIAGMFDPYERSKLHITKSLGNNLPHLFSLGSVIEFWHKLPVEYAGYVLVFLISLCWFIVKRKYLLAVVLVTFSCFYWLVVIMSSPEAARFYTEYLMLPLGFMAALPLIVEIIPSIQSVYTIVAIVIFCAIRLGIIYHNHIDYTRRLDIYQPYFDHIRSSKLNGVFVDPKIIDGKKAIITWGSGYESILISSLASPDSCKIVQIDKDLDKYRKYLDSDSSLVTIYAAYGQSQLPDQYFRLQGGKYEIITKQP
jgi:hypothetical protein